MGIEEKTEDGEKKKIIFKTISHEEINEMSDYRPVELCERIKEREILMWLSAHSKVPFYGHSFDYVA